MTGLTWNTVFDALRLMPDKGRQMELLIGLETAYRYNLNPELVVPQDLMQLIDDLNPVDDESAF